MTLYVFLGVAQQSAYLNLKYTQLCRMRWSIATLTEICGLRKACFGRPRTAFSSNLQVEKSQETWFFSPPWSPQIELTQKSEQAHHYLFLLLTTWNYFYLSRIHFPFLW